MDTCLYLLVIWGAHGHLWWIMWRMTHFISRMCGGVVLVSSILVHMLWGSTCTDEGFKWITHGMCLEGVLTSSFLISLIVLSLFSIYHTCGGVCWDDIDIFHGLLDSTHISMCLEPSTTPWRLSLLDLHVILGAWSLLYQKLPPMLHGNTTHFSSLPCVFIPKIDAWGYA